MKMGRISSVEINTKLVILKILVKMEWRSSQRIRKTTVLCTFRNILESESSIYIPIYNRHKHNFF